MVERTGTLRRASGAVAPATESQFAVQSAGRLSIGSMIVLSGCWTIVLTIGRIAGIVSARPTPVDGQDLARTAGQLKPGVGAGIRRNTVGRVALNAEAAERLP